MDFGDCIQKVRRRLMSGAREQTTLLTADASAGTEVLNIAASALTTATGAFSGAIQPGTILGVDLELFLVQGTTTAGAITVTPGYLGSAEAAHEQGAIVYVNPRFSLFDIGVAINDDLLDLSAPTNGLGQILYVDQTFNPTYAGYDLGTQFISPSSRVLEVSYQIAPPVRTYPLIRKGDYRVVRNANQPSTFPSGNGIVIYQSGYPGLPVHIQFLAPFNPLVNLTDDLTTVAGLPSTMYDLPDLGAAIKLMQPREVKRNFFEAQPDPRKATEVPPQAVANSSAKLEQQRQARINSEADRIMMAYPRAESW
jgi:hypothetical protein